MKITPRFSPKGRFIFFLFLLGLLAASGKALPPAKASSPDRQSPQLSAASQPLDTVETLVMPPVDVAALLAEDELRATQGLPPRFAQPIPVDVTPWNHGTWETLADGTRLWRLHVLAEGALSLNFGFTRYHMPEGGSLVLSSPDRSRLAGPFTATDNEDHGQLWSPILLGDEIVIEVSLPADQVGELDLALTSVNYGYAAFGKPHTILSGACNVDVICPEGDAWRDQIRSVAVISTGGSTFCTGFLVNNTAQDLKGYFMTAYHCGINSGNAASLVTYWNYENSWCRPVDQPINGQPGDGTLDQYNTGSYFHASYSTSDFTLVELDDPIDPAFNVYWAGWNHSSLPSTNATAIHHPNTDEKRISFEYDPTSITSYYGISVPGDGTHIRITDWDLGTTEPGSSGSPLFDQNHRIIGQLHGGYAACGNDESDWYGRFYTSWTGGGSPDNRLSNWLDPLNTGQLTLDGRDLVETPFTVKADPTDISICAPDPAVYGITVTQEEDGYANPVTLSINGVPAGALASFSVNPVTPTYTSTLTISQTELAAPGGYGMVLAGVEATNTYTTTVILNLFTTAPGLPTLLTPTDGAVNQLVKPTFTWDGAPFSTAYNFRLDLSPLFPQPLSVDGLTDPMYTPISLLQSGKCYWWSVQDWNTCGDGTWSEPFHFATADLAVVFLDDIESGSGNWTHAAASGTDHWAVSNAHSHSQTHAWFVSDDASITDSRLWMINPVSVGSGSELTFWHRFGFEDGSYDGAVLEISTNGGSSWSDLGDYIVANGYNGMIDNRYNNPLAGQLAWVNNLTTWTKVEVDLSYFAGQDILIRWRIGCDTSVSAPGWYIDDVSITTPLPSQPAPVLLGISPDYGSTLVDTPVMITGTGFITTPVLRLGDTWLISVTQISTTTLNAIVPAGMPGGTYTLTLYNGDCQVSLLPNAFTVTEEDIPIAGLSAQNDSPTGLGLATMLTATVTAGTRISYDWDFGDNVSGTGAFVSHIYPAVGVYTAVLTATNSLSTAVTNTQVTIENVIPIAGLSAQNSSPTELGQVTTLTATVTAGTYVDYLWNFGDSTSGAGTIVGHMYPAVGVYTAVVTATNGASTAFTLTQVTIVDEPITGLVAESDSPTILGDPTTFTATLTAGTNVTYTWDFGDESTAVYGATVTHTYADPGEYNATVTASNSVGSLQETVIAIVVAPPKPVYLPLIMK